MTELLKKDIIIDSNSCIGPTGRTHNVENDTDQERASSEKKDVNVNNMVEN